MRIGELAKQTGVRVSTLRYYEQIGLLSAQRSESGYRQFAPEAVQRVQFILHARSLGFTLREIRRILNLPCEDGSRCAQVARMVERRIATIEKKITLLQSRRNALLEALARWQTGNTDYSSDCAILDSAYISYRRYRQMARVIEVFTAGCPLCDETLKRVRQAVQPCGCTVVERSPAGPEAQQYGVRAVPTIVADGQVIFTGVPTQEQAIALLRR